MLIAPEMLARLFEQAPQASFVLTPELALVAANAAGRRLLGQDDAAMVGKPLFALLPAASVGADSWQSRLRQSYADLLASRKPVSLLLPARAGMDAAGDTASGGLAATASSIWHVCHAPLLDQAGGLTAIVTYAQALAGIEIAIAQVSGYATTQMATAPAGADAGMKDGGNAGRIAGSLGNDQPENSAPDNAGAQAAAGGQSTASADGRVDLHELLHILLVEDSDDLRLMTVEQLQYLGHRVTGVADAEQAMRLLDAGRFDLLFTDLTLPKMTGAELARVVLHREQPMQVVITSGYGRALANAQSLDALFLPKPYRFDDLKAVLQQVQARRLGTSE